MSTPQAALYYTPFQRGETRILDGVSYTRVELTEKAYDNDDDEPAMAAVHKLLGIPVPVPGGAQFDAPRDTGNGCSMCPCYPYVVGNCDEDNRLCGRGTGYIVRTEAVPLLHLEGILE